jgi:transcriptional regulator of arginine metabolism
MKMNKRKRQDLIRNLLEEAEIGSQSDLQKELAKAGIRVRQPTLSRDLREMAVIKAPRGLGRFVYQIKSSVETVNASQFRRKFATAVRAVTHVGNIIIIKTSPGEAQAVAEIIDKAGMREIVGTVAGDDTIMAIVPSGRNAKKLIKTFDALRVGSSD